MLLLTLHLGSTKTTNSETMMNPDTYTFTGDAVTFLGLIGVVSTAIIMVVAYRRYWNSPFRR
jgi:hypothetical protein